jgi:hypothetical protein
MNKKQIGILILSLFLSGCWTGETITKDKEVKYTPDAIQDSTSSSIQIQSNVPCDSLIRQAVNEVAGYYISQMTISGDQWSLQSSVNLDSVKRSAADSLSRTLFYRIKKQFNVQPHTDSILVLFPVKEMRPWRLNEQIRLAAAWPSLALNILQFLAFVVLLKRKK